MILKVNLTGSFRQAILHLNRPLLKYKVFSFQQKVCQAQNGRLKLPV